MFGNARRSVAVLAVAGALAVSSLAYGSLTSKPSDAAPTFDRTAKVAARQDGVVTTTDPALRQPTNKGLLAKNRPGVRTVSYMKFRVKRLAVGHGRFVGAQVRLTPRQAFSAAVQLHVVASNAWNEKTLRTSPAPRLGKVVAKVKAGRVGPRLVDVSSVVTEPGIYSFALTTSQGTASFWSSESRKAPTMVVRLRSKDAPAATASTNGKPVAHGQLCKPRFPGDPCKGTMYYGAAVEGGNPGTLESKVGGRLSINRIYMTSQQSASAFASRAGEAVKAGRLPLLSTKVPGSWASVASGNQDAWLIDRVKALATVNGPVWFALHHEPRGDGNSADWVAMQQHARKIIDKYAPNVALVGILNGWDFLQRGGNPERFRMPVGTGVDIMGFDTYNPWAPGNGRPWKSVRKAMSPGLTIQKWGYPTLVAETGLHASSSNPGRAAAWLRAQYKYGLAHRFLAISYFSSSGGSWNGTWALSGRRMTAFGNNLTAPTTARIKG
ncbi:MAG: hypothetical protein WAN48_09795 [Actinomycetes bacterium]